MGIGNIIVYVSVCEREWDYGTEMKEQSEFVWEEKECVYICESVYEDL